MSLEVEVLDRCGVPLLQFGFDHSNMSLVEWGFEMRVTDNVPEELEGSGFSIQSTI